MVHSTVKFPLQSSLRKRETISFSFSKFSPFLFFFSIPFLFRQSPSEKGFSAAKNDLIETRTRRKKRRKKKRKEQKTTKRRCRRRRRTLTLVQRLREKFKKERFFA